MPDSLKLMNSIADHISKFHVKKKAGAEEPGEGDPEKGGVEMGEDGKPVNPKQKAAILIAIKGKAPSPNDILTGKKKAK